MNIGLTVRHQEYIPGLGHENSGVIFAREGHTVCTSSTTHTSHQSLYPNVWFLILPHEFS